MTVPIPLHALVMDADPALLAVIQAVLEDEGCRVTAAASPLDLDQIVAIAPDLLLMDFLFAGEPAALPLIERLRRAPSLARLPIILCTAATRSLEPMAARLAALDVRVLTKPFDLDELLMLITHTVPADRADALA